MVSTYFTFEYVLKELLADDRKMIRFCEWEKDEYIIIRNDKFVAVKRIIDLYTMESSFSSIGWIYFKLSEMNKYGWEVILPYNKDYPEFQTNEKIKESL